MNRKDYRRNVKKRLERLVQLRRLKAPAWVIKSEQIALILNAQNLKHYGIGSRSSKLQADLYARYVTPLMEN